MYYNLFQWADQVLAGWCAFWRLPPLMTLVGSSVLNIASFTDRNITLWSNRFMLSSISLQYMSVDKNKYFQVDATECLAIINLLMRKRMR